jgi:hypothetical protein
MKSKSIRTQISKLKKGDIVVLDKDIVFSEIDYEIIEINKDARGLFGEPVNTFLLISCDQEKHQRLEYWDLDKFVYKATKKTCRKRKMR